MDRGAKQQACGKLHGEKRRSANQHRARGPGKENQRLPKTEQQRRAIIAEEPWKKVSTTTTTKPFSPKQVGVG
jgi:hypothetical protein